MPEVTHREVLRLIEDLRAERGRFEAFMIGYVNGIQDSEAEKTFSGSEDFEDRVRELFENEGLDDPREPLK